MQPIGRQLTWTFDPLEALARWPADRRVLMLHSGRYDPMWANRSILAEPSGLYRYTHSAAGGASQYHGPAVDLTHKPFTDLHRILSASSNDQGLWIGYLSYDLVRCIEKLPPRVVDDRDWPIIELGWCPGYLVYDGDLRQWFACGQYEQSGEPQLATMSPGSPGSPRSANFHAEHPVSVLSRDQYQDAVARVIDYIAAGDVFQVNLAQRFTTRLTGDYPLAQRALFTQLATVSPAWYGAYLELNDQRVIASTSPELFLQVDNGQVVTRPIKGTRPASATADELRDSDKDIAELNMIVDLMRNDLGRVCAYGSVQVSQPRVIESHPTVHHGVATIVGQLHHTLHLVDLLKAAMPGGSVTGAPKIRAMQIIDELEPVRRGPYCGAIGWLTSQSACLNIAIRTMLLDGQRELADFSVGGGIIADSHPSAEYDETLDKAAAMLRALKQTDQTSDFASRAEVLAGPGIP